MELFNSILFSSPVIAPAPQGTGDRSRGLPGAHAGQAVPVQDPEPDVLQQAADHPQRSPLTG